MTMIIDKDEDYNNINYNHEGDNEEVCSNLIQ